MTAEEMIDRLTGYFHASYRPVQIAELRKFVADLHEDDRPRVADFIVQTRERLTAISVGDIRHACSDLGVGFRAVSMQEVIPMTCPRCRRAYDYVQAASDQDKVDGRHDRCPTCGLPGHDWHDAMRFSAANNGKLPEWYNRRMAEDWREKLNGRPQWFNRESFLKELVEDRKMRAGV